MKLTFAVDLAKNVFHVAVSRHPGKVAENHRLSRARLLRYFAQQQPATVLMEACSSSHFWARQLQGLGHEVILLPARDVRPYRRGNKTDRAELPGHDVVTVQSLRWSGLRNGELLRLAAAEGIEVFVTADQGI